MVEIAISAARSQLGDLVRRAAHGRETIALTDHGHVAALLVSPQVIEDLEDALAFADYQRTQFGGWPFKRDDPVHPREQLRFARHADGREEQAPV